MLMANAMDPQQRRHMGISQHVIYTNTVVG